MANPSVHYVGSNIGTLHNHEACERVWNGIVRQHTGEYRPPPAYNFGVCNDHGQFFVGRGWGMDSAANGPGGNQGSRALCVLVGPDDPISNVCAQAVNRWAHEAVEQHGLSWPLRPHSSYVATSCPGDRLREVISEINSGNFPDQPGGDFTVGQMEDIAQWEKDTRKIILDVLVGGVDQSKDKGVLGMWEQETRAYIDKKIKESEARIIAAFGAG